MNVKPLCSPDAVTRSSMPAVPSARCSQHGGQPRAPGQSHTEQTGVLVQPPLRTGGPGQPGEREADGKQVAGKSMRMNHEPASPFRCKLINQPVRPLRDSASRGICCYWIHCQLEGQLGDQMGLSTLLRASADCSEPLKCVCLGQVTRALKEIDTAWGPLVFIPCQDRIK